MSGDQGWDDGRRQEPAPPPGPAPGPYGQPYPQQPHDQPAPGQQQYGQPYGQQYGQPGYPSAPPPGAWAAPVPRPGVVPLRHLTLGDILGGAFQTIRRNPRASIGLAFAVSAVFMAVPLLGSLVWGVADLGGVDETGLTLGAEGSTGFSVLSNAGTVFNALATLVITGLMTRVVGSAVVGRPMRAGEAWSRTKGRLWALLGLSLLSALLAVVVIGVPAAIVVVLALSTVGLGLTVLVGVLLGLAAIALLVFLCTRYVLLAVPALVLEGLGVGAALRRAGQLSRGQFWRLFGIALLANLMTGVATQVIAVPLGIVGGVLLFVVGGSWGAAALLLATNLAALVAAALVSPFVAAVTTLQYVDQRFRKEGLDITLLEQSLGDRPA